MGDHAALVLNGLPGAIIAVDVADLVTVWNGGAEQLFGWRADEVLGHPLPNVPPDLIERRHQWLARAVAGEEVEVTTQRLHRDGRRLDVVLRYAVIRDGDGALAGTVLLCRDARPQLRAASRLERSQAELALVLRLASLAQRLLQALDLSAVLQAVVEVGVDLLSADSGVLSLEREGGVFQRVSNVNIPADLAEYPIAPGEGLHGQVIKSGQPLTVDDYSTWEGGVGPFRDRGFHGSLAVPISRDGRVIGVLSMHSRDAERHFDAAEVDVIMLLAEYAALAIGNAHAYRQVATERERFLALVQAMPAGLVVVEDGVVTAWNAAAAMLTGRSAEDVLGGPPPLDLDAAARGLELQVGDGRARFVEAVRADLSGGGGEVYLLQDLTEQRDLDRAKDLFFATTSHELKTPLTVVKGLATTLLRHWDRMDDARRVDALETIERRAENLDRLIERILVGSRVQAGALDVVPTPVAVGRLIEDIVPGFAAAASALHSVRVDLPGSEEPALPLVAGDRQVLDTILGHLLENAIKYSPAGGEVVVRASVTEDGQRVRIDIRDHGIGIEGDVERLLRPFVQADSRTTRRFGGVGLGLYIVRQLVDALHGDLTARNLGDGAEFSVEVPIWR
ncbi:MAG: PAS domain-containing protein [Actinomycetota bacterium]|nr:PAS domain-containing protein [Actinomycetota bacterium]